jgi:hypothetical protein
MHLRSSLCFSLRRVRRCEGMPGERLWWPIYVLRTFLWFFTKIAKDLRSQNFSLYHLHSAFAVPSHLL